MTYYDFGIIDGSSHEANVICTCVSVHFQGNSEGFNVDQVGNSKYLKRMDSGPLKKGASRLYGSLKALALETDAGDNHGINYVALLRELLRP